MEYTRLLLRFANHLGPNSGSDVAHRPNAVTRNTLRLAAVKLRAHPAVAIVHSEWRLTDVLQAVEQGREWKDPEREDASVLVWRQDTLVYCRSLEPLERDALVIVAEGASFAVICEAVAAGAEETNHVALIGRLMARWLADGIIAATDAMPVSTVRDALPSGEASG
jgi:hypothetical protein